MENWKVIDETGTFRIEDDRNMCIADVYHPNGDYNAKIMAAAPEMLAALQLLLYGWNESDVNHDVTGAFNQAQEAINKATL